MRIKTEIQHFWHKYSTQSKITSIIILVLSVFIVAFIVVKASITSFTHDESYTYLHYIHISFIDIISYNPASTNNHILNSLLIKYFEILFGNSEIALRAPNILALMIYLLFTYLLIKGLKPILTLVTFILMIGNPYLLDFFGLARGYGLSFGFMIMSLYYLFKTLREDNRKNQTLFNVAAFLSVLSNFTLANYYIAALISYNIVKLLDFKFSKGKDFNILRINKIHLTSVLIFIVVLFKPLSKILKHDLINFGGNIGFVEDTVESLIHKTFYHIRPSDITVEILRYVVLLPVLISLLIIIINFLKSNKEFFNNNRSLMLITFILLLISFETVLQHKLFEINFPVERFALFLYPLFILNIGFLLKLLLSSRYKYISITVSLVVAVIWMINLSLNIRMRSYEKWEYDMDTKRALETLIAYHEERNLPKNDVKLGINWLFEPTVNFYRSKWEIDWILPADRKGLTENDNYIYTFTKDLDPKIIQRSEIIFRSEQAATVLIKR